jgi:hypothetical protein
MSEHTAESASESARLSSPPPTDIGTPSAVPLEADEPARAPDLLADLLSPTHPEGQNALAAIALSYLSGI